MSDRQNAVVHHVKEAYVDVLPFLVGAVIGAVGGLYGQWQAQAAVNVRPALANVGFIDAVLTNHGGDWLYYNYPTAMLAVSVVFMSLVVGVGWRQL
mgnify:CR=1 FL=1